MPAPRFVTCPICSQGFGSSSIKIHIPQCYEKALKRWQLNPTGPKPVMPADPTAKPTARASKTAAGGAVGGGGSLPALGSQSAARSVKGNTLTMTEELPQGNPNLHACSKCGRHFAFDRIQYHESVCKGNTKRRVFDSSKQRAVDGEENDNSGFGPPPSALSKRKGKKTAVGAAVRVSKDPRKPPSNWRQQHEEFMEAVRAAREADTDSKAMWGAPAASASNHRQPPARQTAKPAVATGAAKAAKTPSRVPPLMTRQNESRKANIASGGRAAKATSSSINTPVPRAGPAGSTVSNQRTPPVKTVNRKSTAFGGGGDRFAGYGPGGAAAAGGGGGGGGGGYRIANDNTTSVGMLQALGHA